MNKTSANYFAYSVFVLFMAATTVFSNGNLFAQDGGIKQEPIKKIDVPNGSPVVLVQVVRGNLTAVSDTIITLKIDSSEKEVQLKDIRLAYKFYTKNNLNHHKNAGIGAGAAGGGVVVKRVINEEDIITKELLKDAGFASGATYIVVFFGSKLYDKLREKGDIPSKGLLYNAGVSKDSPEELAKKFRQLENGSYLELILKE